MKGIFKILLNKWIFVKIIYKSYFVIGEKLPLIFILLSKLLIPIFLLSLLLNPLSPICSFIFQVSPSPSGLPPFVGKGKNQSQGSIPKTCSQFCLAPTLNLTLSFLCSWSNYSIVVLFSKTNFIWNFKNIVIIIEKTKTEI